MKTLSRILLFLLFLCAAPAARAQVLENIWREKILNVPPLSNGSDTLTVAFIGDVMMHAKQLNYDCRTFLEPIRSRLTEANLAVANMEFTLAGEPYSGYPAFSAPDAYADYVADCGVDVFLMANNHILDKGKTGLTRTLGKYRALDGRIRFTGCAGSPEEDSLTTPLILNLKGLRLALVNFTYGTNTGDPSGWPKVNVTNREEVTRAVGRARRLGARYVIALPHWGLEYQLKHSSGQERVARWLQEAGTDAVIGAHPHVVQDTSRIGGMPVVYSMGNAVSNMSAQNTRLELLVTLRIVRDEMGEATLLTPELTFLWCTLPGTLTDSYATIAVEDYIGKRDLWKDPSDYDNMMATWERVRAATGIGD